MVRHSLGQLQVGRAHHCFVDAQVRQKMIVLHYVARHFTKAPEIAVVTIDGDSTRDRMISVKVTTITMTT